MEILYNECAWSKSSGACQRTISGVGISVNVKTKILCSLVRDSESMKHGCQGPGPHPKEAMKQCI